MYSKRIQKVSPKYPQSILKVPQKYPNSIPKISQKYPKNIPKEYQKYPKRILKLSQKYIIIQHPLFIIHHDCLPLEQGWISQTFLISNYDQNTKNRQTEDKVKSTPVESSPSEIA